jgi:hypothetical protein
MIQEKGKQARLAGRPLGSARHVCAFFHSAAEKYDVLGSFILEGFRQGDKAVHVVDPARKLDHCRCLEQLGMPLPETSRAGKLDVLGWDEAFLRGGRFQQWEALARMEEIFQRGARGGAVTRYIADMEWSRGEVPGARELIEFEARLNYLIPKNRDVVICTYDLSRFNASTAIDILRAHPMALVGGILQENPFFASPAEFLDAPEAAA